MADLIFKAYTPKSEKDKTPKPKKDNTRKPISKSITEKPSLPDKSLQINSYDVPFEVSPVEAAGINHWCQTIVGDNETRVQDIQVLGSELARTRGMYSDCPCLSRHLYLLLCSNFESREGWLR
ncbi:hypothetical protein DL98DRAFT_518327 [Cadophora sp. DSE1049]|nr:hypothetical protein DL98DRAFT_518327 [Cadophora sp. DSE1049]